MLRQSPLILGITLWFRIVLLVAAIHTTSYNIHKSYVLSPKRMCFAWISEPTAIIALYSINWLVFTAEMECVYCAVRTGSLIQAREALLRVLSVFLCQCLSTKRSTPTIIYRLLLPERQMGEAWETSKKRSSFKNRGALGRKELPFLARSQNWEKRLLVSCLSEWNNWTDFNEIWYLSIFGKSG